MESDTDIERRKSEVRMHARAARRAITPELKAAAELAITERVLALPEVESAGGVLLYSALSEEADPGQIDLALRTRDVRIAYPRVIGQRSLALHWVDDPSRLVEGAFGLLEPEAGSPVARLEALDLIVVPGVAFDLECYRLGFGGGYYDTLLEELDEWVLTVGIGFEEQVIAEVPRESFDRPVHVLVTPQRTIRPTRTT